MNIEKEYLLLIQRMPDDVIKHIKEYIPFEILLWLDKKTYIDYHHLVKTKIKVYENYIRDLLRRDNSFVMNLIMKENFKKWIYYKKYVYKNIMYSNYVYFLLGFCIDHNSNNCMNIIKKYLNESGLSKNQHKKNVITNIRWSN